MTDFRPGEFFVLGFDGLHEPVARLRGLAERYGLGGVCLFARNVDGPVQIRGLTRSLKAMCPEPWFVIATDQEGGDFQRLPPPLFGTYPAARDLKLGEAFEVGARMGQELAGLGITLDLAPVLDVDTNPDNPIINVRSFSRDPELVAAIGVEFIRGLSRHGVHACGKHFPGHGDSDTDSHLTLPTIRHDRARLDAVELHPFSRVIDEANVSVIMPAHIVYTAIDPVRPGTYSPAVLDDLLRDQLGFAGVVLTDDMGMEGALSQGELAENCVEAFAAGCDQLLVCEFHDLHEACVARLGEAIEASPALKRRAAESRRRIRHTFA
ncbi:MAG: beta-N-acetylhexosaminidase [Myxococcales bacterium]|nr:beta-N-acetylhexosaminidase [Myxococcales bacterium]MCB9737316.1 beta-N-acetylhexosaminidase [Deltaproteobacteria bacterium]